MPPRMRLPRKTAQEKRRVSETGEGSRSKKKQKEAQAPGDHDGIIFKPDSEQKARYAALLKRPIAPTRYMCEESLKQLGMKNDVFQLLGNACILNFALKPFPTYARLTLEFLSSCALSLNPEHEKDPDVDRWLFHFRIFNKDYTLTLTELGEYICLPADGEEEVAKGYQDVFFWKSISMRDVLDDGTERALEPKEKIYEPRKAKMSKIYSPVFRYVLKVICYGIFGKSDDAGVFSILDNYVLKCIIDGTAVNFAYLFASSMVKHGQVKKEGNIPVGGLITAICNGMGIQYQALEEDSSYRLLDLKNGQESHWLTYKGGAYWYLYQKRRIFKFPYPSDFSFLDEATWKPTSALVVPWSIQRPPTLPSAPSSSSMPSEVHIQRPFRNTTEIRHEALMGKLEEIKQQGDRIEKNHHSFKKKIKKAIAKIFAKLNITPPTSSDEEGNPKQTSTTAPESTS